MSTDVDPAPLPREPAAVPGGGDTGAPQGRLAFVFRAWLRAGHVHPLLHLIHQYRAGQRR
jgi:hypothetical protein